LKRKGEGGKEEGGREGKKKEEGGKGKREEKGGRKGKREKEKGEKGEEEGRERGRGKKRGREEKGRWECPYHTSCSLRKCMQSSLPSLSTSGK
jgi:hypothetical protein